MFYVLFPYTLTMTYFIVGMSVVAGSVVFVARRNILMQFFINSSKAMMGLCFALVVFFSFVKFDVWGKDAVILRHICWLAFSICCGCLVAPDIVTGGKDAITAIKYTAVLALSLTLIALNTPRSYMLDLDEPMYILMTIVCLSALGSMANPPKIITSLFYLTSLYLGLIVFSTFLYMDIKIMLKRMFYPQDAVLASMYLTFDTMNIFTHIRTIQIGSFYQRYPETDELGDTRYRW